MPIPKGILNVQIKIVQAADGSRQIKKMNNQDVNLLRVPRRVPAAEFSAGYVKLGGFSSSELHDVRTCNYPEHSVKHSRPALS